MRQTFLIRIYDDCPIANPKAVEFIVRDDNQEDAKARAASIRDKLFPGREDVSMHVRAYDGSKVKDSQYRGVGRTLVSFRAIQIPRIVATVGPLASMTIPKSTGWFARAECHMTDEEMGRMTVEGIPFRVVRSPPRDAYFPPA